MTLRHRLGPALQCRRLLIQRGSNRYFDAPPVIIGDTVKKRSAGPLLKKLVYAMKQLRKGIQQIQVFRDVHECNRSRNCLLYTSVSVIGETMVIGGADGPTSIFIAARVNHDVLALLLIAGAVLLILFGIWLITKRKGKE